MIQMVKNCTLCLKALEISDISDIIYSKRRKQIPTDILTLSAPLVKLYQKV